MYMKQYPGYFCCGETEETISYSELNDFYERASNTTVNEEQMYRLYVGTNLGERDLGVHNSYYRVKGVIDILRAHTSKTTDDGAPHVATATAVAVEPATLSCKNCGASVSIDANFCPSCGTRVLATETDPNGSAVLP